MNNKTNIQSNPIFQSVKKANSAARELRLAGLGMISRMRNNSGKLFADLVVEGEDVQNRASKVVSGQVNKIRTEIDNRVQIRSTVDQARSLVSKNTARLEDMVQNRVSKVLNFVGVPSKAEIKKLDSRVATLRREIRGMKPKAAKAA